MKRCPICNRTYANDEFAFCLADGTLLSAPYNPIEARKIAPTLYNNEPQVTEVLQPQAKVYKEDKKANSSTKSVGSRRKWTETDFLSEVTKTTDKEIALSVLELYHRSKEVAGRIDFGSGTRRGSFNVKFTHINTRSLYTVFSDGTLELNFPWLQDSEKSAAVAERFGRELRILFGSAIPDNFLQKYVSIKVEQWSSKINSFMRTVREVTKI
jgi:hypothetical protein